MKLKHFKVNVERNKVIVDVQFYQMDLRLAVESAIRMEAVSPDFVPSWSKVAAAPPKSKGFFVRTLESIFLGKHGADELNSDIQFERYTDTSNNPRVAMMFFSKIRNDCLAMLGQYAEESLPGFIIQVINGDVTTNREAERKANDIIDKATRENKSVLFLAASMAQRSFSVKEITELYLAYDNGQEGATIQKMSRALTPGEQGKIGRIISLSFDPNRDDKFDTLILTTAKNYKRTHDKLNIREALKDVLRTVDIFSCTTNGRVVFNVDEYTKQLQDRNSLTRIIGKSSNLSLLTIEELQAVAQGNVNYSRTTQTDSVKKGKTKEKKESSKNKKVNEKSIEKTIAEARKVITTVIENIDFVIYGSGTQTLEDALTAVEGDIKLQESIKYEFGIDFSIVRLLFDSGTINKDLVQLVWDR